MLKYVKEKTLDVVKSTSSLFYLNNGSGALSVKMLFVRIAKDDEIDAYFRAG